LTKKVSLFGINLGLAKIFISLFLFYFQIIHDKERAHMGDMGIGGKPKT
jgi:hypothetical protein